MRNAAKRTKPRAREALGLTHEKVRRAALRLIDEEGLEEFSTRKLGRALGCEAMAIYWYYPSKDALLDGVVDLLVTGMGDVAEDETADWVAALRQIARAYRKLAHAHPKAFPLLATRRFATPETYAFLERLFALGHRQGLPDRTIARYFRAVSGYCSGVALDEIAGARRAPKELPRVCAVFEQLAPKHDDELFDFGLEILLAALSREARAVPRARR